MNSVIHARSSARRFGGDPQDYQRIHDWFDASKAAYPDQKHRALRHHSFGIFECEAKFGHTVSNAAGDQVPVRLIAEQHVIEDLGFIPTVEDWLKHLPKEPWMSKATTPTRTILTNLEAVVSEERKNA